ncbi:MAG: DUF2490 domain-containing protein [Bacteroidales bacterium]
MVNGHTQDIERQLSEERDIEYRTGFLVSKEFKDFEFFLGEELRIINALNNLDRLCSMLGSSYRFNKYIKVGADFSHIFVNNQRNWENRYRNNIDLILSYPINNQWQLSLRERLWTMVIVKPNHLLFNKKAAWALRSRLMTEYKVSSPITLQSYVELSTRLFTPLLISNYMDRMRCYVGMKYTVSKTSEIELYYRFDHNIDKSLFNKGLNTLILNINKRSTNIIGIFYNHSF